MFCAAGETIDNFPIYGDTFSECPWQYWLAGHLNSSNDYWVADLRSHTPHRPDFWGQLSSIEIDRWLQQIEPEDFDAGLGLTEIAHVGEIVVMGGIDLEDSRQNSSLVINSALVNPSGARSLLHALQSIDNPNDFRLPVIERGFSEFEIDESGFKLTAWMREIYSRDETLDKFDRSARDRGFNITAFQPHFAETVQLQPNSTRTEYLRKNSEIAARLELWSDNLDEEYISHPYSSGERWWVSIDFLLEYLRQCDRDLIIEVKITRNRNERNRRETGENYEYNPGKSRIYVLRQNGLLETLDSHRDIRTAAR